MSSPFIKWFADTGIEDVPLVGGKNASLGEMVRALTAQGVKVPNGFSMTADAYRHFLRVTGVDRQIAEILTGLDSISLTPGTVLKTTLAIVEKERSLSINPQPQAQPSHENNHPHCNRTDPRLWRSGGAR